MGKADAKRHSTSERNQQTEIPGPVGWQSLSNLAEDAGRNQVPSLV